MDFSKFKLELITDSIQRIEMSDEEYFTDPKWKKHVSNSKLKLINPDEEGSPKLFKEGIKQTFNSSFELGSAVHGLTLESSKYLLSESISKPTAKLGLFTDKVFKYRSLGNTIYDSMLLASEEADYYNNKLSVARIKTAIKSGLTYYLELINGIKEDELGRTVFVLSEKQRETCINCVNSINKNKSVKRLFSNDPMSLSEKEIHFEDALFADLKISFPINFDFPEEGYHEVIIPLKMKADNWTFDGETLVLNDLKTTGKPIDNFKDYTFLNEEGVLVKSPGSFSKYHYYRQMAMYLWMIKEYLNVNCKLEANMIVVETLPNYTTNVIKVSVTDIKKGMKELKELLCRVAYCEIYGYDC